MKPLRLAGSAFVFFSLLTSTSFALSPDTLLFQENFESLSDIQQLGGSCTIAGTACDASVFVTGNTGNAIQFNKTNFPLVTFPVTYNGNTYINPLKGTIVFNYVPLGSPSGDWGAAGTPANKTFFHLRDPNVTLSRDQTLKLGTYFDTSTSKYYLYFRYDATSGCSSGDAPPYDCQRVYTTSGSEPGVIMQWQPNTSHKITASWDFTATKPYLALFVDGNFAGYHYYSSTIGLSGFNPSIFYVGSMLGNAGTSAQGRIDNLAIYSDVALDPSNPVPGYIEQTKNDGTWQSHETIYNSTDAPAAVNLSGQPFIFYTSYAFEPIFEGNVPATTTDATEITIDVAKNQHETAFFNIYAGDSDLTSISTTVSNLTSGNNTIDQTKIKIRTVKNWWQAGKQVNKEIIPAYVPELLLYDDTKTPQCTGTQPHPCANGTQYLPSDPASTSTQTTAKAHTSRQFAVTLDIPANAVAGDYTGMITTTTSGGTKTLPIKVRVHNFSLPQMDKIVALYNHSQFDISGDSDLWVSQSIYQLQTQNMFQHGVNGLVYYGFSNLYPSYATASGLTKFGAFNNLTNLTSEVSWLNQYGLTPYIYGVDEPASGTGSCSAAPNRIPDQLLRSKAIHAAQGLVTTAITKSWADTLNNPSFFPHTDECGNVYQYSEGKLDLPNLAVEFHSDATTENYFSGLLNGTITKASNPEVYYWQMDREDPRINRFYAGYHLWLTDLAGVFPYVYQKLINDPYNDFDQASGNERDLNVVYPSQEGGIDTIEWEAFREGLDDYRLLKLWKTLYTQLQTQPNNNATQRKATLDTLLAKYKNTMAFSSVAVKSFADDRQTLITEIDGMTTDLTDSDGDGIGNAFDNCPTVSNPTQADQNNNGTGDVCEPGLTAKYYNSNNFSGTPIAQIDAAINFNWGNNSPVSGINANNFSVRWTGKVLPPVSGTYKFCVSADDTATLWINGAAIVSGAAWNNSPKCGFVTLTQNVPVSIQMDYIEYIFTASAKLTWAYPTGNETQAVVPTSQLYAQ